MEAILCVAWGLLSCPVSVWLQLESQLSLCPRALLPFSEKPWGGGSGAFQMGCGDLCLPRPWFHTVSHVGIRFLGPMETGYCCKRLWEITF